MSDQHRIGLKDAFRFRHEPVGDKDTFVGRESELERFVNRILLSEGGTFLLAGYRGVGKTSFVNQAIRETRKRYNRRPDKTHIVDVHLNLARAMSSGELMHHIIRRIYHRLHEKKLFGLLDRDFRDDLELAYRRTSMHVTNKVSDTMERTVGSSLGLVKGILGLMAKIDVSRKRTQMRGMELAYLGYDEKAAEYDVISLSTRLAEGFLPRRFPWLPKMPWTTRQRVPIKIIFVFDEMDKLERYSDEQGRSMIDGILESLKNIFTTARILFIFVAGRDLHERWLEDLDRGDSIYESVFAYDHYLPCHWEIVNGICDAMVTDTGHKDYQMFKDYLAYKGRGIPRKIIREFNKFVRLEEGRASLVFDRADQRLIQFYADLQEAVREHFKKYELEAAQERTPGDDKTRLGTYHLFDWILGRGSHPFTREQAIAVLNRLNERLVPHQRTAFRMVDGVIEVLEQKKWIELLTPEANQLQILGSVSEEKEPHYHLTSRIQTYIRDFSKRYEEESVHLDSENELPQWFDGYILAERIGRGGMGEVFRALDHERRQSYAIKVFNKIKGTLAEKRFRREHEILANLDHPGIVACQEFLETPERLGLVMEMVEGVSLQQILDTTDRLEEDEAITIIYHYADILGYVHEHGIFRNDIKPANLMINRIGQVKIIDFGISKRTGLNDASITQEKLQIGTPYYFSPEQANSLPIDARSEIYSLGVVLYQMVTGELPFSKKEPLAVIYEHLHGLNLKMDQVPHGLQPIISRCLERDPAHRYQNARELMEALPKKRLTLKELVNRSLHEADRQQEALDMMTIMIELEDNEDAHEEGPISPAPEDRVVEMKGFGLEPDEHALKKETRTEMGHKKKSLKTPPEVLSFSKEATSGYPLQEPLPIHVVTKNGTFTLKTGRNRVGRASDNDIYLHDSSLSRYHAELILQDGKIHLRDLGSANGTRVEKVQVTQPREIKEGEVIQFGNQEVWLQKPMAPDRTRD